MLHKNERPMFRLMGKVYLWVRVNGRLELRPALVGGKLTPLALDRLAEGK